MPRPTYSEAAAFRQKVPWIASFKPLVPAFPGDRVGIAPHYAVHYNFLRIHKTLRVTPAMAAGIADTVMDWVGIVEMMDADQSAKKRGPYKKRVAEISN